jgi:hypothetical protein
MTATHIEKRGDITSRRVVPDFEGAKFHHWAHMKRGAESAGTLEKLPRKPRSGLAEESFFAQVDTRMSRRSFGVGVSFDANGRIIREIEGS